MFETKYSKFLTALLIIVVVAIIGLLAFLGYDLFQKYFITKDASEFVDAFVQNTVYSEENVITTENTVSGSDILNQIQQTNTSINSNGATSTPTYQGFNMVGTMEIPVIDFKYPILEKETRKSIEVAVAVLYGPGPNKAGNTVIAGHNYRNGLFFSNNKKLNVGDKIYITDNSGVRLTYTIYSKFETTDTDTEYMTRDTNGAVEVSLTTCTDDSKARLIILAKAD